MEAGHPALVENMLETVDAVLQPATRLGRMDAVEQVGGV